jgi:hypothetical protein
MAGDWEPTFATWYQRASDAEQTRYENTRKAINEALRGDSRLDDFSFDVYAKGSYPAFTNVVRDSDVDVAVELTTFYGNELIHAADGLTIQDLAITPYTGDATLPGFKDDVEKALVSAFGSGPVERGKKAIHIRESTRSLKADVVPCVTHKTWVSRSSSHVGIRLHNDAVPAQQIHNYPKQHLELGTKKNDATSRRYKRVVRILKRLENEMVAKSIIEVVPSFLLESAVYNVPNASFNAMTWTGRIRNVLAHIYNGTMTDDCVASDAWLEVNRVKYLFHPEQSWSRETAHNFAARAWSYLGLES